MNKAADERRKGCRLSFSSSRSARRNNDGAFPTEEDEDDPIRLYSWKTSSSSSKNSKTVPPLVVAAAATTAKPSSYYRPNKKPSSPSRRRTGCLASCLPKKGGRHHGESDVADDHSRYTMMDLDDYDDDLDDIPLLMTALSSNAGEYDFGISHQ